MAIHIANEEECKSLCDRKNIAALIKELETYNNLAALTEFGITQKKINLNGLISIATSSESVIDVLLSERVIQVVAGAIRSKNSNDEHKKLALDAF